MTPSKSQTYNCKKCKFITHIKYNFDRHCNTKKHINLVNNSNNKSVKENKNIFVCDNCNKEYLHYSSYYRHSKGCGDDKDINNQYQSDRDKIKELEYKLEIEKIKLGMKDTEKMLEMKELQFQKDIQIKNLEKELEIKDLKKELELKELENKTLLIVGNMQNNRSHTQYNIMGNNININNTTNKKNVLNMYFNSVIDIDTFTSNFKNDYGLTNEESKILMENYESMGINSYTNSLFHYLKTSAVRQYKALGVDMKTEEIILPFVNSDASLRQHFEKDKSGEWKRTSNNDKIKRLIIISNDHVYKNHKKLLLINPTQRKRISNAILKASNYSIITNHLTYKDSNILEIESDKFKNLFLKDKEEKYETEEDSDGEYEIISEDNFINNLNSLCNEQDDEDEEEDYEEDD
jgi:hypothetical protein